MKTKPLRIAVTGGRGRIAPYMAAYLSELDSEVVCFSRAAGGCLQDVSLLREPATVADFDTILHLAWSTVPLTSEERPGSEKANDLPLLEGMLSACAALKKPPHFVFFSTAAVYGNTNIPATEKMRCQPLGGYARSKLMAENIIRAASQRQRALRCGILRISNVFGMTSNSSKPQGIIPRICRAIHDETPMSLWGDGGNTKDYLFAGDFLNALRGVITQRVTGTFNVASEVSLSVNDIISLVESYTGKRLKCSRGPAFPWDVERGYVSARKLRTATGWYARSDLTEAIRELTDAQLRCV